MPSCPRCGAENPEGKAACWSCFAPMSARPEQFREAAVAAVATKEAAPSRRGVKVLVPVLVIVAAAAALCYVVLFKPGPATIGRRYLEAVKAGDAALQDKYTTQAAKGRMMSGVALLKALGAKGIRPTEVSPGTIPEGTGDTRTLTGSLTFGPPPAAAIARVPIPWRERIRGGGTVPVVLTLVREGGWKVNDITVQTHGPIVPAPTAPSPPGGGPGGGNPAPIPGPGGPTGK